MLYNLRLRAVAAGGGTVLAGMRLGAPGNAGIGTADGGMGPAC